MLVAFSKFSRIEVFIHCQGELVPSYISKEPSHVITFLVTLVALHFTPVSRSVIVSNQRSLEDCKLVCQNSTALFVCFLHEFPDVA